MAPKSMPSCLGGLGCLKRAESATSAASSDVVLPDGPRPSDDDTLLDVALHRAIPGMHSAALKSILQDSAKQDDDKVAAFVQGVAQDMHDLFHRIIGDTSLRQDLRQGDDGPDGKLHAAMYAALKQHASETSRSTKLAKAERTLRLMGIVNVGMELVKDMLLKFYPPKLYFSSNRSDSFTRCPRLDKEGRPIYKSNQAGVKPESAYLSWHSGSFGGYWSAYGDEKGEVDGTMVKWAPLPFDRGGRWVAGPKECYEDTSYSFPDMPLANGARRVMQTERPRQGTQDDILSHTSHSSNEMSAQDSHRQSYFHTASGLVLCTAEVFERAASNTVGSDFLVDTVHDLESLPRTLQGQVKKMLYTLERGACLIAGEKPPAKPEDGAEGVMHQLLSRLAERARSMSSTSLDEILGRELPGYPFELSFVQLLILNCRLIGISRLRHPSWPTTLVRLHDFVARAWREPRTSIRVMNNKRLLNLRLVRYLDLTNRTLTERELPEKRADCIRFVFISDTHAWTPLLPEMAWDNENESMEAALGGILLPKGDILLHGGDLLNEAVGLQNLLIDDPPIREDKLVDELENLNKLGVRRDLDGNQMLENGEPLPGDENKFKWIFFVGGNHDAPLHMLASLGKLQSLLGDSVVMLQTPAEFDLAIPLDKYVPTRVASVAKGARVEVKVMQGAVRVCADCSICEPNRRTDEGIVIAGSGLSLANNAWSANRAFQIQRSEHKALRWAAEQLVKHEPDVVMTHGPPKGYCDEKKGDQFAREVIDSPDSTVKLHLFGHAHSNGLAYDDRPWKLHGHYYPGRCFVNGSSCTQLYLPIRLPIVFDLPARPRDAAENPGDQLRAQTR